MPRFAPTITLLALLAFASSARAQNPLRHPADAVQIRYASSQPVVNYTLRVDSADLSGFEVEMRIRNAPDTFRLAMAAHPEYDDRFWRYVERLRVESRGAPASASTPNSTPAPTPAPTRTHTPPPRATIAREDSALWRVIAPGGESAVHYRIKLPAAEAPTRAAWRPFLAPTGGLVGGPHAFMYMLGATLAPSHVALELPRDWQVATGLEPTHDPRTFFAPSAHVLVDSPLLVGQLRSWRFSIDGVPHRIAYWPLPNATLFDTAAFVHGVEQLARQAVALFGRAPYREFNFLFQDAAYGGLEHLNSVTLGAPSSELASSAMEILAETAHEFFHSWNLMRIRPAERGRLDYRPNGQTAGLWWSEGITMYYADLLRRRAGLPVSDSTRMAHLEALIARYLFNPGNSRVSPERASLVEYGSTPGSACAPASRGGGCDYDPSVHLQGELLGGLLDMIVRDASNGGRSLDDVMRVMLKRYSGERGFTGRDIQRTVAGVCGCDVRTFFDSYVREGKAIDFDRYLRLIGLRATVSWTPALDRDGRAAPDLRIHAWLPPGETALRLLLTDPGSAWGRAGLHTGDRIETVNGAPMASWADFRSVLSRARVGDTVRVEVARPPGSAQPVGNRRTTVVVTGYNRPIVRIEEVAQANERQRAMRARWLAGAP